MSNIISNAENGPIDKFENRPFEQLVHSHGRGKWIRHKELKELALKKYHINGRGITFTDVVEEYGCSKAKAQLRLKNGCKENVNNGKKSSVLFRFDNERTNPQQYYPSMYKGNNY